MKMRTLVKLIKTWNKKKMIMRILIMINSVKSKLQIKKTQKMKSKITTKISSYKTKVKLEKINQFSQRNSY